MIKALLTDFKVFGTLWFSYLSKRIQHAFADFEKGKNSLVERLMFGRGKMARPFIHAGMVLLVFVGIVLAPVVASSYPGFAKDYWQDMAPPSAVLSAMTTQDSDTTTAISDKPRSEVLDYKVENGDTVSQIAQKFGISTDTIRWANDLESLTSIKPGQVLKILPVTGVLHKVKRGETVYSIAKYFSTEPQGIVDFPFNTFADDENFTLIAGQELIVPDGVTPKVVPWSPTAYVAQKTPDAGTITASGQYIWPTSGRISQGFHWYHKGVDIANKNSPAVLAADSGKVITAGWPDNVGYGNRVIIDHGNGYRTLYGHLAKIFVVAGQTVNRGDQIGIMGSTGRSTGPHLHFEIRSNNSATNPMNYLK